jgi:hypothetical protein
MKSKTTSLAAFAAFILTGPASAATLLNAGFETDTVATNDLSNITPASWTGYGAGGKYVIDGNPLAGISGAHSGSQYFLAYANSGIPVSQIRQDSSILWSNMTVGDTLTMSAYTTYRTDVAAAPSTYFWLNDTDAADDLGLNSAVIDVTDVAAGVWTLRSWTYTITQPILDLAIADSWGAVEMGIGIVNFGGDGQVAFDSVSLTHIPEPGAALLGSIGMLALLRRRRLAYRSTCRTHPLAHQWHRPPPGH